MRKVFFVCLMIFVCFLQTVSAQELIIVNEAGGAACFQREHYKEVLKAARENNESWIRALQQSGKCFAMKRGLPASMKDHSLFTGISQIYLHPPSGGNPVIVWTANENFRFKY